MTRTAAWWRARALAVLKPRSGGPCRTLAQLALAKGDRAAAERWCTAALQRGERDAETLATLGSLRLARNDAKRALAAFAEHAALIHGPGIVTRAYRPSHLDLERAKRGRPYYRELDDVLIDTAYWSIMTRDGLVYAADVHGRNLGNSPFVQGRVTADGSAVIASYPEPTVSVAEECILTGGDDNYSHWLFRNLLKLVALGRDGMLYRYPWLLNRDLAPYQADYLELLGVPPDMRVPVDRGQVVHCRRVIVPALLTSKRAIAEGIEWIRGRLAGCLLPEAEADRLIYVSRSDAARRRVANEDELIDRLSALGFTAFVAGHHGAEEQIRIFSSARLIVCAHGAAMTNMIFAPAHAAYVELCSSNWSNIVDFRRIAGARRQTLRTLVSDRYPTGERPADPHADYCVDVDAVVEAVHELLAAAPKTPA